jgi:hypothetical protein
MSERLLVNWRYPYHVTVETGTTTLNTLPTPNVLLQVTVPPISSTIRRVKARPIPSPSYRREWDDSTW